MYDKLKRSLTPIPSKIPELVAYLLKDEAISGKLIVAATVLALIAANTLFSSVYEAVWNTQLSIGLGEWVLTKDLHHWINEGLMAVFFLVVGLELKREFVKGELRKFRSALLPIGAAVGGMVVPALIYIWLNHGMPGARGWAIPMATDIAFAIAILAFVGKGLPSSIRLFLLTLAIVDDLGVVILIALFYNSGLNGQALALAAGVIAIVLILQKFKRMNMGIFIISGIIIWLAIDQSGVHASIAGAIIGLLAPLSIQKSNPKPIAERLEHATIPLSTLLVVPLFAFANTGIVLTLGGLSADGAMNVFAGIILGLVVGKVLGIVGASWILVKLNLADLPEKSTWNHIIGAGLLAGIGFTVSIFVTDLAFDDASLVNTAKLGIFVASIISGALGVYALRYVRSQRASRKRLVRR